MNRTQTKIARHTAHERVRSARAILTLAALLLLLVSPAADVFAQKGYSKKYPTRKNVRIQLTNLFGTITVETWERNEVKISADMYPPIAPFTPEQTADSLVINVKDGNRGRGDVGDVNFKITVPVNSSVDIETRRGDVTIRGVRGAMVRAKVWTSGDIELTEIESRSVMAETITGNVFYDGQLVEGGKYELQTVKGDITISLPANSAFSLMAAAPSRQINLGTFANPGLNLSDGRKVYGTVGGDARCSIIVFNQRGSITFARR